jgi:hypothetical protein
MEIVAHRAILAKSAAPGGYFGAPDPRFKTVFERTGQNPELWKGHFPS